MTWRNPVGLPSGAETTNQFNERQTNVRVRALMLAVNELQEVVARQQQAIDALLSHKEL